MPTFEQATPSGIVLIHLQPHVDERGWFTEMFRRQWGFPTLVQVNHSWSRKGVLRGLHYQHEMGKFVHIISGEVFDVALDLVTGKYFSIVLNQENAIYIPFGFAHGFLALQDSNVVYGCTTYYNQDLEGGIRWDSVGIDWPIVPEIISEKDRNLPAWEEWREILGDGS